MRRDIDTSVIGEDVPDPDASDQDELLIERLSLRIEELESENVKLRGKKTVDDQKARILVPFSWAVFSFTSTFCTICFAIIIGDGLFENFNVDVTVLSLLAGSTIASVVGLLASIVTGLLKSK